MNDRYRRGLDLLNTLDREQGARILAALQDIAPDFARYLIEFPFGDVYSRPGLDLKTRELATVAALTAMANAAPQLKIHVHGAMNVGASRQEILEVIIQMAILCGVSCGSKWLVRR